MRRSRDVPSLRLGRRPDSAPSSSISARSPFVCVSTRASSSRTRSFVRSRGHKASAAALSSPTTRSSSLSAATASTSAATASPDPDAALEAEDAALRSLAADGRARLLAARGQSLASRKWRQRRASASEMVFDRRGSTFGAAGSTSKPQSREYAVLARTSVPCSAAELSAALSTSRSDELNATLVALLGGAFAFAVTLRDVRARHPETQRLSTKLLRFRPGWGPLALPLAAADKSLELLDLEDEDPATGRTLRVLRSVRRDARGRLTLAGDLLVGYELREQPAKQATRVFFLGALLPSTPAAASCGREIATASGLLKLAKLLPKLGAVAVRRRLGAQQAFADQSDALDADSDAEMTTCASSARSLDIGADSDACAACSEPLAAANGARRLLLGSGRRRHACALCGLAVCGRCASLHEVEERIGVVDKRRVCGECVTTLRLDAFRGSPAGSGVWSPASSSCSASPSLCGVSPVALSRYYCADVPLLEACAPPLAMHSR